GRARLDWSGRRDVRGRVSEDDGHRLAFGDREVADAGEAFAVQLDVGSEDDHVRAGDGAKRAVVEARDPGHNRAIVEAEHQLDAHLDATALADDHPREIGGRAAEGHEVDERDRAGGGLELGFEDQRAVAVAPRDARIWIARRDLPAAVLRGPEQRREARAGIEARPAEPVDRSIPPDERRRLAISNEGIVLDASGHDVVGYMQKSNPSAALSS